MIRISQEVCIINIYKLDALRQKIVLKRDELDKQRVNELDSLLHKYKNVRKEMDIAQGLERSKLDVLEKKVSVKHYDTFDSQKNSYYNSRASQKKSYNLNSSQSHFRKKSINGGASSSPKK